MIFILDIKHIIIYLEKYCIESINNFKRKIPKYLFKLKVNERAYIHIRERKFINIKNVETKEDGIYIDVEFEAIWQGVEFAFGYGKDLKILSPQEAIVSIKEKSLEVLEMYKS